MSDENAYSDYRSACCCHWHACPRHQAIEWGIAICCGLNGRNLTRTHMPRNAQRAWAERVDADAHAAWTHQQADALWARTHDACVVHVHTGTWHGASMVDDEL
jgi:hypothetical protein